MINGALRTPNYQQNFRRTREAMSDDILDDLKSWLAQLVEDRPHRERRGELPEIEIGYVSRAIAEIERLRAAEKK